MIIVLDNAKLGRVAFGFEGVFRSGPAQCSGTRSVQSEPAKAQGCELGPTPDFAAVARAYGGNGMKAAIGRSAFACETGDNTAALQPFVALAGSFCR